MSTLSYPYVEQDMTSDLWRKVMTNGDCIIDDYAGNALGLTVSTDTATVAAGMYRLNGQVMENPSPLGFTLPAVVTTTVYQVGVRFDPSKDGDPLGPLTLVAGVKGAITVPAGGGFYVQYEVTRNPGQAMSGGVTPVVDFRRWVGDSVVVRGGARPVMPRGSYLWDAAVPALFVRDMAGASLSWVRVGSGQQTYSATVASTPTIGTGEFSIVLPPGTLVGSTAADIVSVQFTPTGYAGVPAYAAFLVWSKEYTTLTKITGKAFLPSGAPASNTRVGFSFTVTTKI